MFFSINRKHKITLQIRIKLQFKRSFGVFGSRSTGYNGITKATSMVSA